jgi:hypothetical protein
MPGNVLRTRQTEYSVFTDGGFRFPGDNSGSRARAVGLAPLRSVFEYMQSPYYVLTSVLLGYHICDITGYLAVEYVGQTTPFTPWMWIQDISFSCPRLEHPSMRPQLWMPLPLRFDP